MNVPMTYPPKRVNGFLISDFTTPTSATDFTYPQGLKATIADYRIGRRFGRLRESAGRISRKAEHELSFIEECHDIAETRTSVALRLMKQWDPDFFIVVFRGTDELQHLFWGREDILLEYYQKIDNSIACILAESDKDTNVLIISDHGFGAAATKLFSTNGWLEKLGLLKRKRNLKSRLFRTVSHLAGAINRRTRFGKRLPRRSVAAFRKATGQGVAWHHTKAYGRKVPGIAGININLRGREPRGIVEPGQEYERLREQIIAELKRLTDPETGERVMAEVYKNNEIYWGENLAKTPDIVGVPNPQYRVAPSLFTVCRCGVIEKDGGTSCPA
jgi:predicted AlkP superfamily phosphohydrolase/phosphomutase